MAHSVESVDEKVSEIVRNQSAVWASEYARNEQGDLEDGMKILCNGTQDLIDLDFPEEEIKESLEHLQQLTMTPDELARELATCRIPAREEASAPTVQVFGTDELELERGFIGFGGSGQVLVSLQWPSFRISPLTCKCYCLLCR